MKRVRISSLGLSGVGTKVVDLETMAEIQMVTKVDVTIEAAEVRATIHIFGPQLDVEANGTFCMRHPRTGARIYVKSITTDSGDVIEL